MEDAAVGLFGDKGVRFLPTKHTHTRLKTREMPISRRRELELTFDWLFGDLIGIDADTFGLE